MRVRYISQSVQSVYVKLVHRLQRLNHTCANPGGQKNAPAPHPDINLAPVTPKAHSMHSARASGASGPANWRMHMHSTFERRRR